MTDDQVMRSVADAVREAGDVVRQRYGVYHATAGKNAVTGTGLIQSIMRATYTGAYALAFGIVYPVVFMTELLPQDNPVMDGFSDGAHDAAGAVKGTGSANHTALDGRHRDSP
jgi:hypothetical protein